MTALSSYKTKFRTAMHCPWIPCLQNIVILQPTVYSKSKSTRDRSHVILLTDYNSMTLKPMRERTLVFVPGRYLKQPELVFALVLLCVLSVVRKKMDAPARASVSEDEERRKRVHLERALEIGNELLQHPPSSKEELIEKLDAMGLFSNTKESNFPETSEEHRKRKNSPSQKEALVTETDTKKSDFPQTSKEQHKRNKALSQEKDILN